MTSPIQHVSDTAHWVAHYRAQETSRPDALFQDPLAARLSAGLGASIAASVPRAVMTSWQVVMRTVIIDRFILELVGAGADAVVNLGAGLDTRPYRLALPSSLTWIEADFAPVVAFKEGVLAGETPRCVVERVAVDLADAAARGAWLAGIAARFKKVVVLTEGVVPYLSVEDAGALADALLGTPCITHWVTDYLSAQAMKYRARSDIGRKTQNAPFRFTPPDWLEFYAQHGWKLHEMRYLATEGRKLGRPFPAPPLMKAVTAMISMFQPREGVRPTDKAAGYAVMVRAAP